MNRVMWWAAAGAAVVWGCAERVCFASPLALSFDFSDDAGAASGPLGPGHAVGVFTGGVWNVLTDHFSGTALDEFGNPVSGISVQIGANNGGPITNWGTVGLAEFGSGSGGPGVHDTALMKDQLYNPYEGRAHMGVRMRGLPAGTYEVFFLPRWGTLLNAIDVGFGVNINQITDGVWFTSPALSNPLATWVEGAAAQGGNYFRGVVTISGPQDWIVMIARVEGTNNIQGFQIAMVPEPGSMTLLGAAVGPMLTWFGLHRRKRRRPTSP